jgi:hypothetical protein
MHVCYDIFQGTTETDALWIAAVKGLLTATERMNEIAGRQPGHYFLFDVPTKSIVAQIDTRTRAAS